MERPDIKPRTSRQLKTDDVLTDGQYAAIAKLIYDTDPYIYPAMFGRGEKGIRRAAALLPSVFETGRDPMFAKGNLYVLEEGGEITGLILWHRGSLHWDAQALLDTAGRMGIRLNRRNVGLVKKGYVESCYDEGRAPDGSVVSLINVCVDREKRGRGSGGFLLENFIREHAGDKMELVVLCDNAAAVRLYEKHGFVIASRQEGFAVGPDKPMCFTMRRPL